MTKTVDTTLTDIPGGIVFNNTGSVAVTTGTLDFAGGGVSTGSFNVGPGAGARLQLAAPRLWARRRP